MHPTPTIRTECGTAAIVPGLTGEQRRLDLEASIAADLARTLQLDLNIVFHYATSSSVTRAADFLIECATKQSDHFFAQFVSHLARPEEAAVLASLAKRWMVTAQGQAVQVLADAADDGQRFTFESRQ